MANSILIIPPFIKYSAGPLLGPALLQSAARKSGHSCSILDLNAILIQTQVSNLSLKRRPLVGDHNKPVTDDGSSYLAQAEKHFMETNILPGLNLPGDTAKRVQYGFLDHSSTIDGAKFLALSSPFGKFAREKIVREESICGTPDVVGISLLHAGQVIPAVAITMLAREQYPNALVVWGGPHVSGLGNSLEQDLHLRGYAADVFVTGHADRTFVDILNNASRLRSKIPLLANGVRGPTVAPQFDTSSLQFYDEPLTLPAQSSLGCAYGRCSFCTYPAIESVPTKLPLDIAIGSVVRTAEHVGANIAIKDSLATPLRLQQLAGCIDGRAKWSACTKLSVKLDRPALGYLRDMGLATLEVGLESLLPETQRRIDKIQPQQLFEKFLEDVAMTDGLALVVNYMVGFPWEDQVASREKMVETRDRINQRLGAMGHMELNHFELERLSPMMKDPTMYGIDHTKLQEWPWASVLERSAR